MTADCVAPAAGEAIDAAESNAVKARAMIWSGEVKLRVIPVRLSRRPRTTEMVEFRSTMVVPLSNRVAATEKGPPNRQPLPHYAAAAAAIRTNSY